MTSTTINTEQLVLSRIGTIPEHIKLHLIPKKVLFACQIADRVFNYQVETIVCLVEILGNLDILSFEKFSFSIIKKVNAIYPCQKFEFWHTGINHCTLIAGIYSADILAKQK